MILYVFFAFYYIVCMLIEKIIGKSLNRKIWVIFLLFPLFVLAAFRAPTVGTDTLNYYYSFLLISQESLFSESSSRMEIGYVMFVRLLSLLGFNYLGVQIVSIAFVFFAFGKFILKYSHNIAFSIYIFVTTRMFFGTMNITRQYIAVGILLLSVDYLKKRKFFKFLLTVLLASLFHTTAIVFLVIYPIVLIKLNFKKTLLFIGIGLVSSLFFDYLVQVFINITGRYQGYLESGYFNFEGNIAIYFNLLINFSFFIVALMIRYWNISNNEINYKDKHPLTQHSKLNKAKILQNEVIWYAMCLITFILSIIGLNSTITGRIELYFSAFFVAFIPSLVNGVKIKELRALLIGGIIIGLFASFVVIMILRPNWNTVFPYNWFWEWE